MLDKAAVASEEEALRIRARALSGPKRSQYFHRLEKELRDPDSYAVLNYLFVTGLHHFYLGNWLRGSINFIAFLVALYLIFNGMLWLGISLIIITSLSELYALFNAEMIVQHHNNQLMAKILEELESEIP